MHRRLLVAAALAALALAGCGADDAVSKRDFVARADAVCSDAAPALTRYRRELADAQRNSDAERVYAELADATRGGADAATRAIDRLDALATPGSERDDVKAWIAAQRRQQLTATRLADAYRQRDTVAIGTLSERLDRLDQANRAAAARLGVQGCAALARAG